MARRSITTQKVLDETTAEWRPLEEVVGAAIPTVPPGKALRKYEGRPGGRKGVRLLTEDEKIRSGARHFAMVAVRTLSHSNTIETAMIDGVHMIRRRNKQQLKDVGVCPECHRPYDPPEVEPSPFATMRERRGTVIFPPQFNKRRFG